MLLRAGARLQHGARSAPSARDRHFLPTWRSAANPPDDVAAVNGWDRQTDGRTDGHPHHACGVFRILSCGVNKPTNALLSHAYLNTARCTLTVGDDFIGCARDLQSTVFPVQLTSKNTQHELLSGTRCSSEMIPLLFGTCYPISFFGSVLPRKSAVVVYNKGKGTQSEDSIY